MPPAMPLAMVMMSGTTPSCSQANHAPVRQNPDWTSSAMKTMPLSLAHVCQRGQEALGRDDEAALALDRLDDDRGDLVAADLLLDHGDGARGGLGRRSSLGFSSRNG